jgi:hypothetical protein
MEMPMTGGCQCGAVRYRLREAPTEASICHCRMCQKAFGSYFAPLGGVPIDAFSLTRGRLATFKSSDLAERGFCRDCGTPLTFRYVERPRISIALGSLDDPEGVRPIAQDGIERRLSFYVALAGLPGVATEQDTPELARRIAASNHQHPDYDTDQWPTEGRDQ